MAGSPIHLPSAHQTRTSSGSECIYTPILYANVVDKGAISRCLEGYNFFADLGIEATSNTIACCLTAYNEPLDAYQLSLSALAGCAEYFRLKGEERVSREFVICIIVDGLDKMSRDFARYAQAIGIYVPEQIDPRADFHMFESQVERGILFDKTGRGRDASTHLVPQRIILFIKTENRGKLDSHRCFFDMICNFYSSAYFVQIDVGTAPKNDALYHMWKELQHNPNLAATAARSLLPQPSSSGDLLGIWQFCDIAMERIVNWPTEILMGNLSVLPGQLSLTRISSITGQRAGGQSRDTGVLDNYYRGLSDLSPFESNMYLAEDRILGLEMVFQENNKWELSYETDAEATVDSCETWTELCKQRRRWICSSMACRFSMLAKLPAFFRNTQRNGKERVHKSIAALYFLVYSVMEWLVPASHMILQTALTQIALSLTHDPVVSTVLVSAFTLACAGLGVQLLTAIRGTFNSLTETLIEGSVIAQSANLALTATLLIFHGVSRQSHPWLLISFSAMIAGYAILGYFYRGNLCRRIIRNLFQYTFARMPVKAFLMTYSIFNAHNTSWGTKGLDSLNHLRNKKIKRRYLGFRVMAIAAFCTSNIAFYLMFHALGILENSYTVIAMLAVILLQIAIAFLALAHRHLCKLQDNPL